MRNRGIVSALCGAFLFVAQAWAAAPGPYYEVTNLGVLYNGTASCATAINNKGQVAGYGTTSGEGFETHAFLWEKGEMTDLGTLGGYYSAAYGINGKGVVVGESADYDGYLRAFVWHVVKGKSTEVQKPTGSSRPRGEMTDLGTLGEEYSTSSARGINDNNAIVGYSSAMMQGDNAPDGIAAANGLYGVRAVRFAYSPKKQKVLSRQDLGTLGGPSSLATAIRNDGVIVGWADLDEEGPEGFVHHAFVFRKGIMEDFGTLPGDSLSSAIFALNGGGCFAGASDAPYYLPYFEGLGSNAANWKAEGIIRSLGALPGYTSIAYGVNNGGLVVGHCGQLGGTPNSPKLGPVGAGILPPSENRAFIWSEKTGILDLNVMIDSGAGWILNAAYAINNKGWIVGEGTYDGEPRAFLLKPVKALPQTVSTTTTSTSTTTTSVSSTTTNTVPQ